MTGQDRNRRRNLSLEIIDDLKDIEALANRARSIISGQPEKFSAARLGFLSLDISEARTLLRDALIDREVIDDD